MIIITRNDIISTLIRISVTEITDTRNNPITDSIISALLR